MKILTRPEYLACRPGLSADLLDTRRLRGHAALAFGADRPSRRNEYADLDLPADYLVCEYASYLGWTAAASIVRFYWPNWIDALGMAEHKRRYGAMFAVGKRDMPGPRGPLLFVGSGTHDELQSQYEQIPDAEKPTTVYTVDMWAVSLAVRADAAEARITLSDPLFVPHDDPLYTRIITAGVTLNDKVVQAAGGRTYVPTRVPAMPAPLRKLIDQAFWGARSERGASAVH